MSLDFALSRTYGKTIEARLTVPAEGVTVLFGPSGAGKSTILRCLAGLDREGRGTVQLAGEILQDARTFVPPQRRRIALLAQQPALFPHLTVAENVAYGGPPEEAVRRLHLEPLLARKSSQLSGGEAQRVALARALASRPRALLLDEPLSSLDAPSREELRAELRPLLLSLRIPVLLVTHDRIEALALGDRLAVLANGVRQSGPVQEVFGAPNDAEVARIVGLENVLAAQAFDGLVRIGSAEVQAVDGLAGACLACIRAEEIVLERTHQLATSARNQLPARIVSLAQEGPLVRVVLDCGFRLVALVTRPSAESMQLQPGLAVFALFKAQAVRLIPR